MSHEIMASLKQMLRDSIERLQSSTVSSPNNRALTRALAHLCSAHDEMDRFARARPIAVIHP
jgi:hypothetical protein